MTGALKKTLYFFRPRFFLKGRRALPYPSSDLPAEMPLQGAANRTCDAVNRTSDYEVASARDFRAF